MAALGGGAVPLLLLLGDYRVRRIRGRRAQGGGDCIMR